MQHHIIADPENPNALGFYRLLLRHLFILSIDHLKFLSTSTAAVSQKRAEKMVAQEVQHIVLYRRKTMDECLSMASLKLSFLDHSNDKVNETVHSTTNAEASTASRRHSIAELYRLPCSHQEIEPDNYETKGYLSCKEIALRHVHDVLANNKYIIKLKTEMTTT